MHGDRVHEPQVDAGVSGGEGRSLVGASEEIDLGADQ